MRGLSDFTLEYRQNALNWAELGSNRTMKSPAEVHGIEFGEGIIPEQSPRLVLPSDPSKSSSVASDDCTARDEWFIK
jgi:hypothetical protein